MSVDDQTLVEIRLLGPFRVRRTDGSWVDPALWRTRKTMALLQMLAFRSGQRISVDELIAALWPGSDLGRGRTSLRTAASQIRKVLGSNCIARSHDGLVLQDVWVDTRRFKTLADHCRQSGLDGHHVDAVMAAHQAEALHVREPSLLAEADEVLSHEREELRRSRSAMLVDASSSALALRWTRDAVLFAERALALEPHSEQACRVTMRANHAAGEIERALMVYQECKSHLVEDFGVDPSVPTQNAYLELLRSESPIASVPAFVGLEQETVRLAARISSLGSSGCGCIVVAGPPGAGASRWLDEVTKRVDLDVHTVPSHDGQSEPVALHDLHRGVNLVDGVEAWPAGSFRAAVTALGREAAGAARVVLAVHRTGRDKTADIALDAMVYEGLVERFSTPVLDEDELVSLAHALISSVPTPELVDDLRRVTGSHPGLVVETIAQWLNEGRLAPTTDGLELASPTDDSDSWGTRLRLVDLHEMLSGDDLRVLEVLAVADQGISVAGIVTVLAEPLATATDDDQLHVEMERVVSRLEELALLTAEQGGRYSLRQRQLRDAIGAWTRPATRRRLHRRAAERLTLSVSARVGHWIEGGEPELACATAVQGAVDAMNECDFAAARHALLQVRDLVDHDTTSPEDRLDLANRMAICCQQLGYDDEAAASRAEIDVIVADHGLTPPPVELMAASSVPGLLAESPTGPGRSALLERLGLTLSTAPTTEVEALLRDAIVRSDSHRCWEDAIEARLLLAGLVLAPRRSFGATRQVLREAAELKIEEHRVLTYFTRREVSVLLGAYSGDLGELTLGSQEGPPQVALTSGLPVTMLSALAHHDHGDPTAEKVLDDAINDAESRELSGPWRWVAAGILVQRGDLDRAKALTELAPWRVGGPTPQILALLGMAELGTAEGRIDTAAAALLRAAEIAQRTGATLLLPDVAARMVLLGDDDEEGAFEYLDLAEVALGEATFGRERVMTMLARAAVRAMAGRPMSAAVVAGGAATLAASLGLQHSAIQASARRAAYLAAAGGADGASSRRAV